MHNFKILLKYAVRGLSDFHKLVLHVLKTFDKNKPCEILYRDYKNSKSFNKDLQNILSITLINTCKQFEHTFLSVLNIHAPLKKKLFRANHSQYVTRALRKAIMRRSKPEKIFVKKQINESLKAYKKQKRNKYFLFQCSPIFKYCRDYMHHIQSL